MVAELDVAAAAAEVVVLEVVVVVVVGRAVEEGILGGCGDGAFDTKSSVSTVDWRVCEIQR